MIWAGAMNKPRVDERLLPLFQNNRTWAESILRQDPEFFQKLSHQQRPEYLWIGCADSRVPANEIVGLLPGELFVHRNVANIVVHSDLNCLATIQFAVDVLQVKDIIVCGHYGCGGVQAALRGDRVGLADNWLGHIKDIRKRRSAELAKIPDPKEQLDRMCEWNVAEQVDNVVQTTIVHDAWARGQELSVHGVIYDIGDGILRDLGVSLSNSPE